MKERVLNVLKWFFIILGIIFFIQILLIIFVSIGFQTISGINSSMFRDFAPSKNSLKQIQPIIDFAENYKTKNNKYPETVGEDVKLNKNLDYKYEVSKDRNCYTVTVNLKKNSHVREYKYCKVGNNNSVSTSESYVEYAK